MFLLPYGPALSPPERLWSWRKRNAAANLDDPDTERVWWREAGVNQNLTFPVQTDPVSAQHCWHQKVRVTKAGPDDQYGDIVVDTDKSHQLYKEWLKMTRPAPGPGNLRRPLWLDRPLRPAPEVFQFSHP